MKKSSIEPAIHFASLPERVRDDVVRLDREIDEVMGEPRSVWIGVFWGGSEQTIVGYGDLVQMRPRGKTVEWFKIGLAVQKNYISVYVNAVDGERYIAEIHAEKLGKVKVGKASISFRSLAELDLPAFRAMLKRAAELMA